MCPTKPNPKIKPATKPTRKPWPNYLAAAVLAVLCGWLLLAWRIWDHPQDPRLPADAAVVLGTAVINDQPSPVFAERLRHAIQLYHSGRVQRLVFTGGLGQGDQLPEAEVGRRYALQHRVPANAILLETQSHTTWQNLVYARPLLQAAGIKTVLLVSDPLHLRRALLQAHDLGISAQASATPSSRYRSLQTQLPFLFRESWFLASYLITRWLN